MKNTKGITLMALIVTIIVLMILSGVTIASLTGQKGIIKEAKTAKELAEKAALEEQVELAIIKAEQKYRNPTIDNVIEELKNNKVISKDNQVNKETGAIRTDLGYEITGKLDDYIGKVSVGDGNTTGDGNQTGGGDTPIPPTQTLPTDDNTKPYLPESEDTKIISNNPETGIIIQDSKGNEWVWIEVPKSIYTTTTKNTDYDVIEKAMQTYASAYRNASYTDKWDSINHHGLSSSEYTELKNSMLKSVFDNGGFYIGRYEAGTESARYSKTDALVTPLIQRDKYPYIYITCKQAQTKAKELTIGEKNTSLMFGIQWDLVLKFIEEKGKLQDGTKVTQDMLKGNSVEWGNYYYATFEIKRQQALYTATPRKNASWDSAYNYTKPKTGILLTTGATDRNSVLGIYDLGGNVSEWTLEYTNNTNGKCTCRGDYYSYTGEYNPYRRFYEAYNYTGSLDDSEYTSSTADGIYGFRPAMW